MPMHSKFISIDGTDGCGKATQVKMLVERLISENYPVEMSDFPQYGTKSAGPVEEYLNGKYGQVGPHASSIFYAVDRFDASFKIREWLNQGKVVVSNRYVTANAGHQGGKIADSASRIEYFKWLNDLEYNIFKIPRPDLNIILHVPAEMAQQLVDKKSAAQREYAHGKKRDLHEGDIDHLKNAEKVYMEIARIFPNTELVECVRGGTLLTPEEIHGLIWEHVKRSLETTP